MSFVLTLLHDTFVVALALVISIPLSIYITYSLMNLIKGVVERIQKNGES